MSPGRVPPPPPWCYVFSPPSANSPMSNVASSHHWVVCTLSFVLCLSPYVPYVLCLSPPQAATMCLSDMQVKTEWPLPQGRCVSVVQLYSELSWGPGEASLLLGPLLCWTFFVYMLRFLFTFWKYLLIQVSQWQRRPLLGVTFRKTDLRQRLRHWVWIPVFHITINF